MLIRKGERLKAAAHARARELATTTAMEPETGLVSTQFCFALPYSHEGLLTI